MEFKDYQWEQIKDFLPGKVGDIGRSGLDNRLFIEAVMWVARNGGRWRSLPPNYGKWNSVFQRFQRWAKYGIWQVIFNTLATNSDNEWLMIDSTIVRAHQSYLTSKKSKKASV
jgi:transposase